MKRTITILRNHILKLAVSAAVVGMFLLALAGCKDFSFFNELGVRSGLTITPASASILTGGTMSFNASGGNGDYVFSIISGSDGTIDPATGVYTAPGTACTEVVMVTDSTNLSATATIDVVSSLDALEINPKVATLSPGSQITFVATGGNDSSYTYGFDTNNSGGTINSSTGLYTAGSTTGMSDTIIVTDADSTVCAIPANVSVVAATSDVNYSVTADTFPAGADAGTTLSGTFTVTNLGTGNGGKPVSWWLYLSDDGVFGGDGEILIASNSTAALTPGDSATVTPTGTWPTVGGAYTLFAMISAEDDMTHSDNIYDAGTITLTVPDVDYQISVHGITSENHVGETVSGSISVDNIGGDAGTSDFSWKVYISSDQTIGVGDTLVASDTDSGLPGGTGQSFTFSGTWPSNPDSYYLVAEVSAADDAAAGNDTNNTAYIGPFVVHYPEVDYYADTISAVAGSAGGPLSCNFDLHNGGTDDSAATVTWYLYVSSNNTLDAGDYLAASDTAGPLLAASSVSVTPSGAGWPTLAGDYYLIVEVESTEDVAAGKTANDIAVSAVTYTTVAPTVNYAITAVEHHGSTEKVPGNTFDARFSYANEPTADDGAADLSWVAYVSLDDALGPEDILVASGDALSPLTAGGVSGWQNFSGTWPLRYGNYYIVVAISTTDNESDLGDNELAGLPVSIGYYAETEPNDEWETLPGTGYNIITGVNPALPIALKPGMTLFFQGTNISNTDRDDVFMINSGTANKITFTVTWDSGGDDLDLYLWRSPGGATDPWMIEVLHNGFANTLSLSVTQGSLLEQFLPGEDLWFDLFCNIPDPGPPANPLYNEVGPYEVVISVE